MYFLIIGMLCFLASTKVTLQSSFAKHSTLNLKGSILYNGLSFLVITLLFLPMALMKGIQADTIFYGVIMGTLSVLYQMAYIIAFSTGKMALTVIINNFSMFIPIGISVIWFDEPFGVMRIIGTGLAILSVILNVGGEMDGSKKISVLWIACMAIAFLSNGAMAGTQKVYTKLCEPDVLGFVAITYLTASVLSFIVFWVTGKKKSGFGKKATVSACMVGVVLGVYLALNTYATAVIPGTLLYPTYNCAVSLVLSLLGVFLFNETLSLKQIVGVAVGTLAIILISL